MQNSRKKKVMIRETSIAVLPRTVLPSISESKGIQAAHVRHYANHKTLINPEKTVLKRVPLIPKPIMAPIPSIRLPPIPKGNNIPDQKEFMKRILNIDGFRMWLSQFSKNQDIIFDTLYDTWTNEDHGLNEPIADSDLLEWFDDFQDTNVFPDDYAGMQDHVEAAFEGDWKDSLFYEHNKNLSAVQEIGERQHGTIYETVFYFNMFRDPFNEKILEDDANGWPVKINENNFINIFGLLSDKSMSMDAIEKSPTSKLLKKSGVPYIILTLNAIMKIHTPADVQIITSKEYLPDRDWIWRNQKPISPLLVRNFNEQDLFDIASGRFNTRYIDLFKEFVPVAEQPYKRWDYVPWVHRVAARKELIRRGKFPEFKMGLHQL